MGRLRHVFVFSLQLKSLSFGVNHEVGHEFLSEYGLDTILGALTGDSGTVMEKGRSFEVLSEMIKFFANRDKKIISEGLNGVYGRVTHIENIKPITPESELKHKGEN